MDKYTYDGQNQRTIEKFLLFIYTVYSMNILIMSHDGNWGFFIDFILISCVAAGWITHVSKYRNYESRVRVAAIAMQISMVIYVTHVTPIAEALAVYMAFVVLLGSYGQAKLIKMTVISTFIMFGYHAFILQSIPLNDMQQIGQFVSKLSNVFLLEYVVYVWTKRNSEGAAQLLDVIRQLKETQRSKDDFVANVSHEIRTPINTICGMSDIILQEELPFELEERVIDIQRAGRNLMSVVSDILDFSELQSGNIELEEEAYNISSTINDIINMTMAKKDEKKIELIVDCDANIPSALLGDEKKLRRVILNLADNAIKFTNEGCVTISIKCRKESYGVNLIVTVKDTGIGMDEECMEKIFSGFSQADSSRKRQEGGIGLGLAISYALVQKMGGAITVKSKLDKGTIIKVVVPQKVLDEKPIAAINDKVEVNVATYIDMEQFHMMAIRDEYTGMVTNMVEQLRGRCHICRNFKELQRRQEREHFSHVFISIVEYLVEREYFDELAEKTKVVVILDRKDEKHIKNQNLLRIYKPFYILSIVSVLNGEEKTVNSSANAKNEKFVTRNAHVLVVDDNRMNIMVVEGVLANYNIKVTTANSGQEALEKIMSANYDFVFMDHMMPEMDGVETMQRIRHKVGTYFQKVPIVALTANAVAGTREMLLKEGFTDFLEKPIEKSVLERVLKRNLPKEKIIYKSDSDVGTIIKQEDFEEPRDGEPVSEKDYLEILKDEGLNSELGVMYCNGREAYLKVLQGYCIECGESEMLSEQLFTAQDWKNYTIAVHGIKGAMRSIGAEEVSELAKQLEYAGKEGNIDFIIEHHGSMLAAYRELFARLRKYEWICPKDAVAKVTAVEAEGPSKEITEEEFETYISRMETAMYSLDEKTLLEVLSDLQGANYKGTSLKAVIALAIRKVEMSDYISAVELVTGLKNRLSKKEN